MDLRSATLFKLTPNEAIVCIKCLEELRIDMTATHRLIHNGDIVQLCDHHTNVIAFYLMLGGQTVRVNGANPVALELPIPYDVETYLSTRNAKYETRHAGIAAAQQLYDEAQQRAAKRDEEKRTRKERATKQARVLQDENFDWI